MNPTIKHQLAVVAMLEAAQAKIKNPAHWTTEAFARNALGQRVESNSPDATCFCSDGALMSLIGTDMDVPNDLDNSVYWSCFNALKSDAGTIIDINDSLPHAEVMAVWDATIQREKDRLVVYNLEVLTEAVEAQPEQNFDLRYFRTEGKCGTLFCTVGLATTLPEFQNQGFTLEPYTSTVNVLVVKVNGEEVVSSGASDAAFGVDSYENLFSHRGTSEFDKSLGVLPAYEEVSDKTLALHRLNRQLDIYKGKM